MTCNAPHPTIGSFSCTAPFKHVGDHTFQPTHDKRVFWRNYNSEWTEPSPELARALSRSLQCAACDFRTFEDDAMQLHTMQPGHVLAEDGEG